jgi:hypothetical protein
VKMIAVKELAYAKVTYEPGDEFECSEMDANTLQTIGFAKRPNETKIAKAEKSPATYKRRDMTAEPTNK